MSGGRDGSLWFVASTGRLRAPWRLTVFGVVFVIAWILANAMVYPLLSLLTAWASVPVAFYSWLMLLATVAALVVALRQVDDRPWSDVGADGAAWRGRPLGIGVALGGAAIGATIGLLLLTGGLAAERLNDGAGFASWGAHALRVLWLLAPAALWEELVFRGYLWRVAVDAGGARLALWSTSVGFGAVHLLNPGAGPRTLGAVVLAGVCLGLVRQATGSVAAAWTAHTAWNWGMAALAHVPVSGLPFETPGWRLQPTEPAWWSGGGWGPEGGGAAILVFSVALFMAGRRGWLSPPAERPEAPGRAGRHTSILSRARSERDAPARS
jgi:membrane protease YdiL (CAAX protease family)